MAGQLRLLVLPLVLTILGFWAHLLEQEPSKVHPLAI